MVVMVVIVGSGNGDSVGSYGGGSDRFAGESTLIDRCR